MAKGVREFAVKRDAVGGVCNVKINDTSGKAADVGLYTWGASSMLADELHHIIPGFLAPDTDVAHTGEHASTILELGAGTGLVGIAAALLWPSPTAAVLTDLPPIVANLAANVALNGAALAAARSAAAVGALDWARPLALEPPTAGLRPGGARVVLAADVLYSEELPELLVGAVCAWIERGPRARVVLAYPLRVFMLDIVRDVWRRMEEAGFECIGEGRAELHEDMGFDDERCQEWCVWRWRREEEEGEGK